MMERHTDVLLKEQDLDKLHNQVYNGKIQAYLIGILPISLVSATKGEGFQGFLSWPLRAEYNMITNKKKGIPNKNEQSQCVCQSTRTAPKVGN
jgi:hypothetical protein